MVDELDRCLPEYTIKVLERLHHLTENQPNIITIISIDEKQLLSSVEQIFGFKDSKKYLEKFINFEVKLDYGTVSDIIVEKYADYIALFDKDIFPFDDPLEECLQAIFKDIDIRTQELLIKKVTLAHKLLYSDKKDYSFMCMEVLLAVMICVYQDNSCFSDTPINASSFDKIFVPERKSLQPAFTEFFKDKFERIPFSQGFGISDGVRAYALPTQPNLYGAILLTWYWMHPQSRGVVFQYIKNSIYEVVSKNHEELEKYVELIKMMS